MGISLPLICAFLFQNSIKLPLAISKKSNSLNELRQSSMLLKPNSLLNIASIVDFLSIWVVIFGIIIIAGFYDNLALYIAVSIVIGGRFRALEELAHFSMHNALFTSRKFGRSMADLVSQFPLFNPPTAFWTSFHCAQHHPNVGTEEDPAFSSLLDAGFKQGMTSGEFWSCLLTPLSVSGVIQTLKYALEGFDPRKNQYSVIVLRITSILFIYCSIATLVGFKPLLLCVLPALLLWLPLFSWISLICEHNWFEQANDNLNTISKEIKLGKRTHFAGLSGLFFKALIFPVGDTYHLTHSILPSLHFRFLPWANKILESTYPEYMEAQHTSGFWIRNKNGSKGSLSFIYDKAVSSIKL